MAAGAVALDGWLDRWAKTRGRAWPRLIAAAWITAAGAFVLPVVTPLLSPAGQIAYMTAVGVRPQKTEVAHEGPLVQILRRPVRVGGAGRRRGARLHALPPEERAKASIFASNYGEAGALNLLGPKLGLPAPVCAHQNHYFWARANAGGDVVIWLQWKKEWIERMWVPRSKQPASTATSGEWLRRTGRSTSVAACGAPSSSSGPTSQHWN